jgi:hypothetical protein
MSSIPPNIIGSIFQAQISAGETSKKDDAERIKQARDKEKLARLADQQQHEVEDADQTEQTRVRRQDERQRNGQDAHDTYDAHDQNASGKLYNPQAKTTEPLEESEDHPDADDHIDLSA